MTNDEAASSLQTPLGWRVGAADGSYAPVEQVDGTTPTGQAGITTMVYHAYEQLPASGNGGLVSLTAQHPTATVDNSRADYRAAIARLLRTR